MSQPLNGGNWEGIVSLEVEVKAEWLRLEEEVRCVKRAPVGICGFSYYGHKHLLSSFPQYPYCLMEGIVIQSPASFNDQIDYSTDTHFHTPLRYLHAFPCHPSFSTSLLSSSIVSLSLSSSSIVSTSLLSSSIISLSLSPSAYTLPKTQLGLPNGM